MIEAMKQLGDFIKNRDKKDFYRYFRDEAKLSKTKKVLFIRLIKKGIDYSFKDVIKENYSKEKPILYRGGAPAGVDVLPSSLITSPEKTLKKIVKWFNEREELEFREMGKILKEREIEILRAIKKNYEEIEKDERRNVLLTIKIIEGKNEKYLGEIKAFRDVLVDKKRFYQMESIGESRGRGVCRLCGKEKEVYGFVLPTIGFSFATADKPGFEYDFDKTSRWKQIPICEECGVSLVIAKSFIDEHLNFPKNKEKDFLGYPYYVIPKFVFGEMFDEFKKHVEFYKDRDYRDGLLDEEEWLMNVLKDKHDTLRLIFLFYKKKGAGKYIDIVKYIEDVLPSWIRKIYIAQENVKKMEVFNESTIKEILGKKWMGNFVSGLRQKKRGLGENNWYAVFLRDFFPSSRIKGTFNIYYLNLIGCILSGKSISEGFLLSNIMRRIRDEAKRRNLYNLKLLTLESLMLYIFLKKLDLLRALSENNFTTNEKGGVPKSMAPIESRLEGFFQNHNITNSTKKASFAVGVIVDYLLNIQREERGVGFGEEPFLERLRGLMLNEKKVKNLFKDAISKMRQYKKGYPALESLVAKYLADSGEGWDLSNDEISYYFTLGLTLSKSLIWG